MPAPRKRSAKQSLMPPQAPQEYISYGEVGHADDTPRYAWVEDNERVYVEVTLRPSSDEVIARLDMTACDEGGFYSALHYGAKVVVAFPGGSGGEPVIIARVNDRNWPFPETVCGVGARGPLGELPMYSFIKTGSGQILALESGPDGDTLVHSGASVQVKTDPEGQILLSGRTHIGADFTTPPVGDTVGPAGEVIPGAAGTPHVPTPGTNEIIPPGEPLAPNGQPWPAEGLMRFKDTVQSNATADPVFWAWVAAVQLWITNAATEPTLAAYLAGLNPPVLPPATVPTSVNAHGSSCSLHTCQDE